MNDRARADNGSTRHHSTEPDPMHSRLITIDAIVTLYSTWGALRYDEAVTQNDHAVQCAALAVRDGGSDEFVVAALLHDIGHLLWMSAYGDSVAAHDTHHELVGAHCLDALFGPSVCEPIRLHVEAKRVLLAIEPGYDDALSAGSRASAARQGGPASPEEVGRFHSLPFADDALWLRRIDDTGKFVGLEVKPFESYLPLLRCCLR